MNSPDRKVEIRHEPLDSPAAVRLAGLLLEELDRHYPGEENGGRLEPAEFTPPLGTFLVAYLDGQPAGCGALRPFGSDEGVAEIKRMYVEPWARGRGVARMVLAELEAAGRRLGYATTRLETGIRQPEALGLYESCGYRRIPLFPPYENSPHSLCFEKNLNLQ